MSIKNVTLDNYQSDVSQSDVPVLIDFYADRCGPCQAMRPELEAFAAETDAVNVCKIDVDNAPELASLFGILSIPTLVLMKDGQEIARRVGGGEKQDIAAFTTENL